ncbi:TNF receptor-like protein CrmB [Cotia virus SPAn232]|uniref:TNF-receptor-like protein CrmB n=2 Tax=Cotia virus TaxID=39444 RepID=H6TAE7_9POXV|nr:TNF-receptor-like protein CrmB [Cotia virus SPAn232]YP_005296367.1 TNF receptor-like protein CrmB [Cotia virus SPAn232]AIT70622.1 TNF-receptor-like protein CrmB [Cotia virus]AFB76897.1 TNF-receptor-like protein CrmB [Cotia virus SPAn232]AFB76981.1 TNF receptor-like protein CrmB [Cotia virus SPAn232]AIT70794.1 TNF receptor-like protein CrmB [Cotia virus]
MIIMKHIILFINFVSFVYSEKFNKVDINLYIFSLNNTDYDIYTLSDNQYKVNTTEVSIYITAYDIPLEFKNVYIEQIQDLSVINLSTDTGIFQTGNKSIIYLDIDCNNKNISDNKKMLKGIWNINIFKRYMDFVYIHGSCIDRVNARIRYSNTKSRLFESSYFTNNF